MTFTAGSKLRASDLVAVDSRGTYSRYTSTTSVAAGGTTVMAPTLSQGSGTGLSLTSNLFTLSSGIWDVDYNIELSSGIGTNTFLNLVISSNTTASVPTGWLAGGTGSGNATTGFLWLRQLQDPLRRDSHGGVQDIFPGKRTIGSTRRGEHDVRSRRDRLTDAGPYWRCGDCP